MWLIGIGTLLSGIVGVSNIMVINIKERTKEIGIRKAIGATPFSIIKMIVFEAIFLTGISGYIGLSIGLILIETINYALNTFTQTTKLPSILRQALPDPNRAKKEAFLLKNSFDISGFNCCSTCIKHNAKALIPDAEEAIPELCGNVFDVSITKWYVRKKGRYTSIRLKNCSIFGLKSSSKTPSKNTSKENPSEVFFSNLREVVVLQLSNVKLMDGLAGI